MPRKVDDLEYVIRANTNLLRADLQRGDRQFSKFTKDTETRLGSLDGKFSAIGRTIRGSFAAFGVGIGVTALSAFAKNAIATADSIGDAAKVAGVGAERFQRLRYVFEQNGAEAREFDDGMQRLTRRLGLFVTTGGGPAAKALKDLGLAQEITNGNIKNSEQLFDAFVKRLETIESVAERAAYASAIFGEDSGPKLVQALALGARGFKEAEAAAKGVFSDAQIAQAQALDDKIKELAHSVGTTLKGAFNSATAAAASFFGVEGLRPEDIGSLEQRIETVRKRLAEIGRGAGASGIARASPEATQERQRLLRLEQELTAELLKQGEVDAQNREKARSDAAAKKAQLDQLTEVGTGGARRRVLTPKLDDVGEAFRERRRRYEDELDKLEDQSLRANDRLAEAIRNAADRQIDEWQRVAEQTPEFADQAARAIVLINERATAEIESIVTPAQQRMQEFADQFAATFESRGIDAILSGDLRGAVRGLAKDFAELVIRLTILKPLAASIADSLSGLGGGGLFSGIGKLFGGGRAAGGPVASGTAYVVGEQGPELFVPNVAGRIMSSKSSGVGSQSINVVNNIDARGASSDLIDALPGILEQNRAATIASILKLRNRPRMA